MAKKAGKAGSGRKAKAAPAKRTFDHLMAPQPAPLQALGRSLRDLVFQTLPSATEGVYGGAKVGLALYAIAEGKKVICGIQPSKEDCLFYLHHLQPEDSPLLKLQGQGKHARHIKVRDLDAETRAELERLIGLARSRA